MAQTNKKSIHTQIFVGLFSYFWSENCRFVHVQRYVDIFFFTTRQKSELISAYMLLSKWKISHKKRQDRKKRNVFNTLFLRLCTSSTMTALAFKFLSKHECKQKKTHQRNVYGTHYHINSLSLSVRSLRYIQRA